MDDVPAQARAVVAEYKEPIHQFHEEVQGRIQAVHRLFNHIAMTNGKSPFTPPAIAMLMGITSSQLKSASELGPIITVDQLMGAFAKLVPPEDTQVFERKVVVHIKHEVLRLRHVKSVMPEVRPLLIELHAAVEGNTRALFEWFLELIPQQDRPGVPVEAFSGLIMQTDPKETKVDLENFLEGVENNIDTSDTSAKLATSIRAHLAK